MQTRNGDWFLTFTGRQFWPLDPRPEDVDIHDIAHHLSLTCRFNGACRKFYSVAQHCCIVSDHLPDPLKLKGLLHDATEAYCGDMVRPLKVYILKYCSVESAIWSALCERFGMSGVLDLMIKEHDNRALMTERRDLLKASAHPWAITPEEFPPYLEKIIPWSPVQAEVEFLTRFFQLTP